MLTSIPRRDAGDERIGPSVYLVCFLHDLSLASQSMYGHTRTVRLGIHERTWDSGRTSCTERFSVAKDHELCGSSYLTHFEPPSAS